MARPDNPRLQLLSTCNGRLEVVKLEPEEDAVSIGFKIGIPDRTVMVPHIPSVQLKDQPAMRDQPLILRATMSTLTAKQTPIPATACFDVMHTNEGLWTHKEPIDSWAALQPSYRSTAPCPFWPSPSFDPPAVGYMKPGMPSDYFRVLTPVAREATAVITMVRHSLLGNSANRVDLNQEIRMS